MYISPISKGPSFGTGRGGAPAQARPLLLDARGDPHRRRRDGTIQPLTVLMPCSIIAPMAIYHMHQYVEMERNVAELNWAAGGG